MLFQGRFIGAATNVIVGVVTKWRCQAKTVIQRVYRYDAEEAEHLDFHVNIIFVIKVETNFSSVDILQFTEREKECL